MKRLTVIGIGPGDPEMMTYEARRALGSASVIAGYGLYVNQVKPLFPDRTYIVTGMREEAARCERALESAAEGRETALVCGGDAGVYGMAGLVLEMSPRWPEVDIRIIPGVTAALSGAALLGAPLGHDFCLISLSDLLTPWELIERRLLAAALGDYAVCLYNPASRTRTGNLARACDILMNPGNGIRGRSGTTPCGYARQIGREGASSGILTLAELREFRADMLTTVFIGSSETKVVGGRLVTPRGYAEVKSPAAGEDQGENPGIALFAGTTEGRQIAEAAAGTGVTCHVFTATEYGASLLPQAKNILARAGRMDEAEMRECLERIKPALCIDATHPHASAVSDNLRRACGESGVPYMRVARQPSPGDAGSRRVVGSASEAAVFLGGAEGRILLTTGSRDLPAYEGIPGFRERCFVRVLPLPEVIGKCAEAGLPAGRVIAMQGPFSEEFNYQMMKDLGIRWLVTKDSGEEGGFPAKMAAAARLGIGTVVIGRPPEDGDAVSVEEAKAAVRRLAGVPEDGKPGSPAEEQTPWRADGSGLRVALVGMGPGRPGLLTLESRKYLAEADLLIGSARMLAAAENRRARRETAVNPEEILRVLGENRDCVRAAVLYSGDITRYSGAGKLAELLSDRLPRAEVLRMPGISSVQYFLAEMGLAEEQVEVVSLHGRDCDILPLIRRNRYVCALAGTGEEARSVSRALGEYGIPGVKITAAERLTYGDERIYAYEDGNDTAPLSLLLFENPAPEAGVPCLIPEDRQFERLEAGGPGNTGIPMTKREVRSVLLDLLGIRDEPGRVFFDIGSGTGSVSVTAALRMPRGAVYAVERNPEAGALTMRNARKFGCSNIRVISGEAPDALAGLPAPDAVFIGGSGGRLKEIVGAVLAMNPSALIAADAVTEETAAEITALRGQLPGDAVLEVREIQVVRHETAGRYHMRRAGNPVLIGLIRKRA